MHKMHLIARVPNEGARKLAWWIGRECAGSVAVAALKLRESAAMLDRLLSGEITPGEPLARNIGERTGRRITRLDWQRRAQGKWSDMPHEPGTLGRAVA